eukprot:139132_1
MRGIRLAIAWLFWIACTCFVHVGSFDQSKEHEEVKQFGPELTKASIDFSTAAHQSRADGFQRVSDHFSNLEIELTDRYIDEHNRVEHVWMRQKIGGRAIINSVANLNVRPDGTFISNAHTFTQRTNVNFNALNAHARNPKDAVEALAEYVGVKFTEPLKELKDYTDAGTHDYVFSAVDKMEEPATVDLVWLQMEDGHVELVWQVLLDLGDAVYDACLIVDSLKVVQIYDEVHWYWYKSFPIQNVSPDGGDRKWEPEIFDVGAEPVGWHYDGTDHFEDTRGNNVWAQENWENKRSGWEDNHRPKADPYFNFKFNKGDTPKEYVDASITDLFYHNNIMHDVFYRYGFNEVSGNFQNNNWGKGGRDRDAVRANSQDGSGTNNANMYTPSDGWKPRMRMYIWTYTTPWRDSSSASDVIYHEYMHGISNRLTGGPSASRCLRTVQARGMGEGWGDMTGLMLRTQGSHNRDMKFGVGGYLTNKQSIRPWPYCSNKKVSPQMYSYIPKLHNHSKGAVWATMLFEVYWNLIDEYGFDSSWLHGHGGNNMMMQLMTDGLKFQPCSPTFIDARDAILSAAQENYGSDDFLPCLIWDGFARRGLGCNATVSAEKDDITVPKKCEEKLMKRKFRKYLNPKKK